MCATYFWFLALKILSDQKRTLLDMNIICVASESFVCRCDFCILPVVCTTGLGSHSSSISSLGQGILDAGFWWWGNPKQVKQTQAEHQLYTCGGSTSQDLYPAWCYCVYQKGLVKIMVEVKCYSKDNLENVKSWTETSSLLDASLSSYIKNKNRQV